MLELDDNQQYVVGVGRVLAEAGVESLATTELLLIIAKQSFYIDELEHELSRMRALPTTAKAP